MFLPIPIPIPVLFRSPSRRLKETKAAREVAPGQAAIEARQLQQEWEQHQWKNMDYSKTYFIVWNGVVRECYCKKGRLQPSDVCCFVDEGKLSQIYTRSLCKTREEAEDHLRKSREPREELVIEPWRGTYRVVNRTTGKVVKVYQ